MFDHNKNDDTNNDINEGVKLIIKNNIAFIEFDTPNSKVNKLSVQTLKKLKKIIESLKTASYSAVILISRKKTIFIAGADIEEIKKITDKNICLDLVSRGQTVMDQLEDLPMMTVAAIHGACMGGGLEVALACDYRLASQHRSTILALPEVKLGLFPGFGGCIRLPRLIGLQASLNMILTGCNIKPLQAKKMNLVEEVFSVEEFEEKVITWVENKLKNKNNSRVKLKNKKLAQRILESKILSPLVFFMAKKALLKKTKGFYPAPEKALIVIQKTYAKTDRKKNMLIERTYFCEVALSGVSKNLIDLFFLTEGIKKKTGVSAKDISIKPVDRFAVLGAGTMGGGIAQLVADKGFSIRMKDITNKALLLGFRAAQSVWNKKLKRKRLSRYDFRKKMSRISAGIDFSGFKKMDIVIEAIVEDIEIKKQVIAQTAEECSPKCIMASNTSSLSITEMAKSHPHPENFIGMHFFNPVDKMPLVEVIRGEKTSDETTATVFKLCKTMGKIPVVVKDSPAFLVNRLLLPWMNEAVFLLEEGVGVEELDKYYTHGFGFPMGPCSLFDEVGIDVGVKVLKIFKAAMGDRIELPQLAEKMLKANRLGKKNSKGFYLYEKQKKIVDESFFKKHSLSQNNLISKKDCLQRGVFLMINEAARALLEDSVVETAAEIDLAMIMGAGFPPFRGGLLKYADQLGAERVVSELEVYSSQYGKRFQPAPSLIKMANAQQKFYS